MSHKRNLDYLHRRRIIYRRSPITDEPSERFDWGDFYENGTHECYELFRSNAKITTYRSLKWHLLVLYYLNPDIKQKKFEELAAFLADKENGFITFNINYGHLNSIIREVDMYDIDVPPKNKLRKIIFKEGTGLSLSKKLKIVGTLIGRSKKVDKEAIYTAMMLMNSNNELITIDKIANAYSCSPRTVYRHMNEELKQEKEILNKQVYEEI